MGKATVSKTELGEFPEDTQNRLSRRGLEALEDVPEEELEESLGWVAGTREGNSAVTSATERRTLLFGLIASGQIQLRRFDGDKKLPEVLES